MRPRKGYNRSSRKPLRGDRLGTSQRFHVAHDRQRSGRRDHVVQIPHIPYLQQVQMMREDMENDRGGWCYRDRILAVRGDSTGSAGDAPMEMLQASSGLRVGEESRFVSDGRGRER